jgi:putative ABC transport system permease protein
MNRERLRNPTVGGLALRTLFRLYRIRLRDHAVQELLAAGGIAVGVALVFGVLVANTAATGSARAVLNAVNGSARLQLAARSTAGFSERTAHEASRLPGVHDSAYLLRVDAVLVGPHGRASIQLVGVTAGLVGFGGAATQDLGAGEAILAGGIGLPSGVGEAIGANSGSTVTLLADGQAHPVLVRAVLNGGAIGALAESGIAVAQLTEAQRLAGEPGRVTQVLLGTRAGAERQVTGELRRLAAGRVDVEPANNEWVLLSTAAKPTEQSTRLFAGISVMVGFLLALNAVLLTVPERRKLTAEMVSLGFDSRQVRTMLAFEATLLGLAASIAGVALGELLARTLLAQSPIYLQVAFPVGTHQEIHPATVAVAVACGMGAALLASLVPVLDLRSDTPDGVLHTPGDQGQGIRAPTARRLGVLGGVVVVAVTIAVVADPALTVLGGVALGVAALALIPLAFTTITAVVKPIAKRISGSMLSVAVVELEATVTRSVALAGVAALAVYGSIAIGGARTDLIRGLEANFNEYIGTADLWVTTSGNSLTTNSFPSGGSERAIARIPGVAAVRAYQGELLDIGKRRMWIIARSPESPAILPRRQLVEGDYAVAGELLRRSGWATVSTAFASEHHLHVGDALALPTPSGPARVRVAATTTNIGWPSGTIILNTRDYARYWLNNNPAALEVDLKPGVSPAAGKHAVEEALRSRPGLRVQTAPERERQFAGNARNGLQTLGEISTLLLLMAALSLAAALSTAIWQRRSRLASLKTQGFDRWQLWRSLLLESAIVLGIGAADGAVLGIYGHALANRWLRIGTGFPAPFSIDAAQVLAALLLVAGIALAVVALPGYKAAAVDAATSFHE